MRKHEINCIMEDKKENLNIQNIVDKFSFIYIKRAVCESGLSKKEQLMMLDELIGRIKENSR